MARILVVFGTRPEAIKLFPVILALRDLPQVTVRTCVTGQHRDLLDQVLRFAGMTPDVDLDLMQADQPLDQLTARLLTGLGEVMDREQPDRVVVQGDTATAMAGALAAYHRRIPVAHVEAGLRSGDIHHPWPEEVNRRIITTIADLHFAPTEAAAAALRRENVATETIHVTGNPVVDALLWTRARIAAAPARVAPFDPARADGMRLLLVTAHRRENFGDGMAALARALIRLADRGDTTLLLPAHPNPQAGPALAALLGDHPAIVRVPPLDYPAFVEVLARCHFVLTDSGGVQEEATALGRPVLVLRDTTERPEGVIAGTAQLIGANEERIVRSASRLLDDADAYAAMAQAHHPYGDGQAAPRIADLIAAASSTRVACAETSRRLWASPSPEKNGLCSRSS